MFHHSPVGVLQLAGLVESDEADEGLQGLLKGLQVHGQLLQGGEKRRDVSLPRNHITRTPPSPPHDFTHLLANVLDQELTELQGLHHLLLHHLAVSFTDLLKTLRGEDAAVGHVSSADSLNKRRL